MDEVEKWLVDQARKFPEGTDPYKQIEHVANRWHEERDTVMAGWDLVASQRDLDKTRVEFLDAEIAAVRKDNRMLIDQVNAVTAQRDQLAEQLSGIVAEQRDVDRERNGVLQQRIGELNHQIKMHVIDKEALRDELTEVRERVLELEGTMRIERGHIETIPIQNAPYLGLATTEEMFRELISRFTVGAQSLFQINQAVALAEILGGLSAKEKEYRTVDDHD